jgi:hypothetical protein
MDDEAVCTCGHALDEHEDLETSMPCTHKQDASMGEIEDCPCKDFEEWVED